MLSFDYIEVFIQGENPKWTAASDFNKEYSPIPRRVFLYRAAYSVKVGTQIDGLNNFILTRTFSDFPDKEGKISDKIDNIIFSGNEYEGIESISARMKELYGDRNEIVLCNLKGRKPQQDAAANP